MAYERNTTEGIRSWLQAELSTPGWNSSTIAKGLTEDVMNIIIENYKEFDTKIRQAIILTTVYMRKGDLLSLGDGLNKVLQIALNDKDDFVKTTANVLKDYPNTQTLDLNIDSWSDNFKSLLDNIGSSIQKHGFNFHPLQDLILQPCARTTPPHVSNNFSSFRATHTQHFTLTTNSKDIISSQDRHSRFKELVELEERSEQAEAQQAQVVAQKRAGAELQSKAKRVASPTSVNSNPFPFPPTPTTNVRPGGVPVRSFSNGNVPVAGASSLYTKRPARPAPAGGGLFIKQQRPATSSSSSGRPIARSNSIHKPSLPTSHNVPRGLQRNQKTQMLDFNAATEIEQNTANAVKQAQDDIKAKQEAKKQEALEKKQRIQAERKEREAEKARLLAEKKEREEQKRLQKLSAETLPQSPTSTPTSPTTPTATLSPIKSIKSEHVFAVPSLPAHIQQQGESSEQKNEKLTTF